ncbi:MAG: NAAT family transporter [Chlamydiia bacterium]|nr:NAAT family transporter [Chlamydiia bacterium]
MDFSQFANHFIALLVITNPLSALPAILRISRNQTLAEKRHIGLVAACAVFVILLMTTWVGSPLLLILGIKLPAFQVAGGVIIFMMALSMLTAEESPIKHTPEEHEETRAGDSGAIVPLAIPIIAGPGAISTIIVSVSQYPGIYNMILISISATLVALVMGLILYFASHLEKMLGQSRIKIINRLGGLILAAIAVQTLASGLIGLFPLLGSQLPLGIIGSSFLGCGQ